MMRIRLAKAGLIGGVAAAILAAAPAALAAPIGQILRVWSNSDGPNAATTAGTLRWAITSNDDLTQVQRSADPRTIVLEPSAGVIAITSELPPLLGPLTVVGAGSVFATPTVGLTGYPFVNPYAPGGESCPSTDGNLPATVIGTTTTPDSGNGPNVRGIFDPLLAVENPTVTGTSPTTYGTSDGTAYGTPNGAFGVAADYNFGPEPNGDVTIDHLVLENSCIGILSLRSHNNVFEHNLIYNDVGAAGIIVTGDAGDSTGSSTSGVSVDNVTKDNTFVDNGDDMEYTRGTSNSEILNNVYIEDPQPLGSAASGADTGATDTSGTPGLLQAGDLPSQTTEYAGGGDNNNTEIGNLMLGGMSDGIQNGGSGMTFKNNYITGDAYAIDLGATNSLYEGNVITGDHAGLVGNGTGDTIVDNSIYGLGAPVSICNAGGICASNPSYAADVLGIGPTSGATAEPGCTTGQNYPVLTGYATTATGVTITGTLACNPDSGYEIQLFAGQHQTASGYGEGQTLVTSVDVTTDASGNASFSIPLSRLQADRLAVTEPYLSSTATSLTTGQTSEFSAEITLPLSSGGFTARARRR